MESIKAFPNSVAHHEELSKFLIEYATDFEQSILFKYKAQMIESKRNNFQDKWFLFFIQRFPNFLKKKILDAKGHFIQKTKVGKTKSQSSNSASSDLSSSSNIIDAQIEEEISDNILTQAKTRLALQRAFVGQKAKSHSNLIKFGVVSFFLSLATIITITMVFLSSFDVRPVVDRQFVIFSRLLTQLEMSIFFTFMSWGEMQKFDGLSLIDMRNSLSVNGKFHDCSNPEIINDSASFSNLAFEASVRSRNSFDSFSDGLADYYSLGSNPYEMALEFTSNSANQYYCTKENKLAQLHGSLKNIISYLYAVQSILYVESNQKSQSWMESSPLFFTLISQFSSISASSNSMNQRLSDILYEQS
jgi:guanylate cyclase